MSFITTKNGTWIYYKDWGPTLVIHGEDDQVVPIADAGMLSAKLVPNATLKAYPGAPPGFPDKRKDQINADLLELTRE